MADWLSYKTRGNSSPQGKPRVLFCCHPADFPLCFEHIAGQLLARADCALWYPRPDALPTPAQAAEDVGQMQLVVFPVTSRFLFQESFAARVLIPAAAEQGIPLLPIIQEPGLTGPFNEAYGNMQSLDAASGDPTALSYEEKLDFFLRSVLAEAALQEKIRQAFHTYIFLSYRKRDRAYARELMRLIHSAPTHRDVAIWYDEFLVPGENFDDAIRAAIDRSGLFAMVITPNSIEPENYVMREEYPYAKERGKPVLPAEFVPTNRGELERAYRQLAPCLSPADQKNFLSEVDSLLARAKRVDREDSPEHRFLIGLAYLGGIDVEVNRDYARSLITSAAGDGLPEASEKLAAMYLLGDGLNRSCGQAARWQEQAAGQWEKLMHQTGDRDMAERYLNCLHHLADLRRELWQTDRALEAAQTMIRTAQVWKRLTGDGKFRRLQMQGCLMAGSVCRSAGDMEQARRFLEEGHSLCRDAEEELGPAAYGDTAAACERLGHLHQSGQNFEQALSCYRSALELRKTWFAPLGFLESQNTAGMWLDCEKLGELCLQLNRPAQAAPFLTGALAHAKALQAAGQPGSRAKMGVSLNNLAWLHLQQKEYAPAEEHAREAIRTTREEWEETKSLDGGWNLSVCCSRMGELAEARGNRSEAKDWYEKSLTLKKELLEINDTDQLYDGIAAMYTRLFLLDAKRTDLLKEAWQIWNLLSDMHPEVKQYKERRDWLQPAYEALCSDTTIKGE